MNPPPPIPAECIFITPIQNSVAMAASTAEPFFTRIISRPISEHFPESEATTPSRYGPSALGGAVGRGGGEVGEGKVDRGAEEEDTDGKEVDFDEASDFLLITTSTTVTMTAMTTTATTTPKMIALLLILLKKIKYHHEIWGFYHQISFLIHDYL